MKWTRLYDGGRVISLESPDMNVTMNCKSKLQKALRVLEAGHVCFDVDERLVRSYGTQLSVMAINLSSHCRTSAGGPPSRSFHVHHAA